jgi:chromosomal replication initiation ATPase DnaA
VPNILIIGPTNNGKSMIVERFKRMHPPQNEMNGETIGIPLLTMQMPSDPTIARFYALLLHAMQAPFSMKAKVSDLETVALDLLRKCNVRMLIIDEIHNMLAGRQNVQREFLNLIRFLGNELRIPIVGIGIREAWHAICTDPQLENRFSPIILPLWQDDIEFGKLLASFISSFPLRKQSYIIDNDTRNYILRRSEGTIGEISSLLTKAAIMAIQTGKERIDFSILELTDYESPTERRRQFEREVI